MPRGSNVWPDLNNALLRPLRYSACPLLLLDQPFPPSHHHPRSPLCIEAADVAGTCASTQDDRMDSAPSSSTHSPTWPINDSSENPNLPQEVYQLICSHLSIGDVKALRLTCKEVNFFVAPILFEAVEVPYHLGIFEHAYPSLATVSRKGKEKKVDANIFGRFGNSIKNFGLRFELPEAILAAPPAKHLLEPRESYWGHYDWPAPYYLRFDHLQALEGDADEGFGVCAAFSELRQVEELAISVDNGLGWLAGPDKSIRDQVLNEREPIVKNRFKVPSRDRQLLWEAIGNGMPANKVPELNSGFLVVSQDTGKQEQIRSHPIRPSRLSSRQIELLLENWWAQQAFLSSYIISVIDFLPPSAQVHTLNIARLPADFLQLVCRSDFWASLPSLRTLKIFVAGQFREVHVDEFGGATSSYVRPSRAVPVFNHLLREFISPLPNVTHLSFGWASGGEHEKGLYGRNMYLLPAPFMSQEPSLRRWYTTFSFDGIVAFPHVENLHIKNCWATAGAITDLAWLNGKHRLRKLTLESVSLLGFRAHAPAAPLPPLPPPVPLSRMHPESWAKVLDKISPGRCMADLPGCQSENRREELPLEHLEVVSCGYCFLYNDPYRFEDLDPSFGRDFHQMHLTTKQREYVTQRSEALENLMTPVHDPGLAEIIQHLPMSDRMVLTVLFRASFRWDDAGAAEEACFDHRPEGGTGRFSVNLRRGDEPIFPGADGAGSS
ncbi:hypothetical protein IWX90DRAFT_377204 [Phyllosticta citrichinensis]|uniref:F-box domain-containing protein n=1 Tax=Phyllosticta citrichinensis TaxID=1130410 RepID=A0ABR1Y785_9PEZI